MTSIAKWTVDQKLNYIMHLLESVHATTPGRNPGMASTPASIVIDWFSTAKPGFYSGYEIAQQCGFAGITPSTITMVGRILDEYTPAQRTKSGAKRGFRIA